MSRFIDKLKKASLSEPPPMGFRTVQKSIKPRLLVIAQADKPEVLGAVDITDAADACLFDAQKAADYKAAEKFAKSMKDIPCGCRISGSFNIDFEKTALDFVIFGHDMPAAVLLKTEKTGRIALAQEDMTGEMIRILDSMPQHAVFLDEKPAEKLSLTWRKLSLYKRFSVLTTKPLLVSVPVNLTADELQAIWDMGVNGLIVKVADAESVEALNKLRQTVETLLPPSKNKRNRSRALVPQVRGGAPPVADDDDDDE